MKKQKSRRATLSLHRETVRKLDGGWVDHVAGGCTVHTCHVDCIPDPQRPFHHC